MPLLVNKSNTKEDEELTQHESNSLFQNLLGIDVRVLLIPQLPPGNRVRGSMWKRTTMTAPTRSRFEV